MYFDACIYILLKLPQLRSRTFELLPKNIPLQSFLPFGSRQPLICLLVLPLVELHINDIIIYILFFFWLCFFSMYLRYILCLSLFLKIQYDYATVCLFIFLVSIQIFFWHQAVVNKGTLCMCLCVNIFSSLQGKHLKL